MVTPFVAKGTTKSIVVDEDLDVAGDDTNDNSEAANSTKWMKLTSPFIFVQKWDVC